MKKLSLLFFCAFLALVSVNAQSKGGTLYHLGGALYMMNVSPDGQYAVGYDNTGGGAFLWSKASGVTFLNEGDASEGWAVSNTGMVVGKFYDFSILDPFGDPLLTAGYFQNNQWHGLPLRPDLINPDPDQGNTAEGVSADGTIIGGTRTISGIMIEPVIWTNNVVTTLEFEATGQGARVQGLSADGTVACGWANPNISSRRPVVWVNGQMTQIKQNNIWGTGEGNYVSPNGRYVALQYDDQAAVYDVELEQLTIIAPIAVASAVSDDGIVVGYTGLFPWDRADFIYTPQLGVMSFSDYLVSAGIPEAETFTFTTPMAISADGLVICGFGFGSGGWVVELDQHLQALNPPKNLTVTENGFRNVALTWEAPTPDPENTFTGYNIYRNDVKINNTIVTATNYADNAIPNGSYTYAVKSVWNGSEESIAITAAMNVGEVAVPFLEDFSTESYNDNYWNISSGSASRWEVSTWNGINPPCMAYSTPGSTYQEYFISPYIDALDADELFLSFNLACALAWDDISKDRFIIEVLDGTTWRIVQEFFPVLEYPKFEYHKFNISDIAANKQTRIRLTARGENSGESNLMWNIDNINVFTSESALQTSTPLRVTAHKFDDGTVHLNWADPGQVATLSYVEDESYLIDVIGNEGVPFIAATKFEAKDLIGYSDYQMVSLRAYLNKPPMFFLPTFKLFVLQGTTRIVDQEIASYEPDKWNTFTLNTPVTITADMTEPLYFGIEVVYHSMLDLPLGLCTGNTPIGEMPFGGRADIFSEDGGQTWQLLSDWDLFGVFALKANLVRNETSKPKERLLGYKVFREGKNLLEDEFGSYITHLNNFTDLNPLANPEACYQVSAYYDIQQESEHVQFCLGDSIIGISSIGAPIAFTIYPNPANDILKVARTTATKARIEICNIYGSLIRSLEITETETEINVSSLTPGIYIIRIMDSKEKSRFGSVQKFVKN